MQEKRTRVCVREWKNVNERWRDSKSEGSCVILHMAVTNYTKTIDSKDGCESNRDMHFDIILHRNT